MALPLYHYFASKDEILIECTRMGLAAVEEAFAEAMRGGPTGRERLESFMIWYAENIKGGQIQDTSCHRSPG